MPGLSSHQPESLHRLAAIEGHDLAAEGMCRKYIEVLGQFREQCALIAPGGRFKHHQLEITLQPTVPGRSVAPMTTAERGTKRDSSPARCDIFLMRAVAGGFDDAFEMSLNFVSPANANGFIFSQLQELKSEARRQTLHP